MNTRNFNICHNNLKIIGDYTENKNKIDIFMLHGAGKSDRNRFNPLRKKLLEEEFLLYPSTFPDTAKPAECFQIQALRIGLIKL